MKSITAWLSAVYLPLVALLYLSACDKQTTTPPPNAIPTAAAVKAAFDYEKSIGWIHGNCLAIKHANLLTGTMITVISLDGQQTTLAAPIVGPGNVEAGCPALLDDRVKQNTQNGRVFYQLSLPPADPDRLAVGILSNSLPTLDNTQVFKTDLNGDGQTETVASCDTSEGMKFSLWSGAVNNGKLLWSDYYYLGYDLQPTCPP